MTTTFDDALWATAFDDDDDQIVELLLLLYMGLATALDAADREEFPLPGNTNYTQRQSAAITKAARAADHRMQQYSDNVSAGIMAEPFYQFSFWEEYDYLILPALMIASALVILIGVLIPITILFMR